MRMLDQLGPLLLFIGFVACSGQKAAELPRAEESAPRFTVLDTQACGAPIMMERHPNGDFRSFHVRPILTTDDYEDLLVADDSPNIELVRDLSEVTGVGKVVLRPREIIIEKSPGFTWEEVQHKVVKVIGFRLGPCQSTEK